MVFSLGNYWTYLPDISIHGMSALEQGSYCEPANRIRPSSRFSIESRLCRKKRYAITDI